MDVPAVAAWEDAVALVLPLLVSARLAVPVLVEPAADVLATAFLAAFVVLEVSLVMPDALVPSAATVLLAGTLFGGWTGRAPRRSDSLMPPILPHPKISLGALNLHLPGERTPTSRSTSVAKVENVP